MAKKAKPLRRRFAVEKELRTAGEQLPPSLQRPRPHGSAVIVEVHRPPRKPALDQAASYAPPHNLGTLNTQVFNELPASSVEKKPAPEPVMSPPPSSSSSIFRGEKPPAPDPSFVTGPTVVAARPQAGLGRRISQAPPPVPTVRGRAVFPPDQPPTFNKEVVTFHVRALIVAFQDVEAYDPVRHHNAGPRTLWSDAPDFPADIKLLLAELRRLNDLLEAGEEPSASTGRKIGKTLTAGASVVYKAACGTVGVGLGLVILGSFAEILSQLGMREELNQILSWAPKFK